MILIAIDDGHGIDTVGKRTPLFPDNTIMKENEFNSAVAQYISEDLKRLGFETILVAPETTDTPLETRVKRANQRSAKLYISIHANAYGVQWNDANGYETWISAKVAKDSETYNIAQSIHNNLILETGLKDRGIKKSDTLYVLNSTKMPAVLVECGFMTNLKEAENLRRVSFRKKCAKGIVKGICDYYNVRYIEEAEKVVKEAAGWKKEAVEWMKTKGYITSDHDPLEIIDIGTLGAILKNFSSKNDI